MHNHRAATTAVFLALTLVLCVPLCSCVEIVVTAASILAGPGAKGALTIQVDAKVSAEEGMMGEGEELAGQEPTRRAIGYVAIGLPARVAVDAVRLKGSTAMVGAEGVRPMGAAPQVADIYATEYPGDGLRWVAYHVILDEVDLRQPLAISLELDLSATPSGISTIWVAPGSIDDATTNPDPVSPTALELAVGTGKATIRIIPPATPAAKGVSA